jgi:multimeric flavodoxin WrbA
MDIHGVDLVLCASPRQGNSEHAARMIVEMLPEPVLILLRHKNILPCTACGLCGRMPGTCSLDRCDDAADVLGQMRAAARVFVVSPVYFYGVPARFKALIDRSQRYWTGALPPQTGLRPAYAVLPAARMRGRRLFTGSLLTLRPFLRLLGFRLRDVLPLPGLEAATSLASHPEYPAAIRQWAASRAL